MSMTFEAIKQMGLTDNQIAKLKELAGDDPETLEYIEANDLIGLGVPALKGRRIVAQIKSAFAPEGTPTTPSAAPAPVFPTTITMAPAPKPPEEMSASAILTLMEQEPGRIEELTPHYFEKCKVGLVHTPDRKILFEETRAAEAYKGTVEKRWDGHGVARSVAAFQEKITWLDPFPPHNMLTEGGKNPLKNYAYPDVGQLPQLHWMASDGAFFGLDVYAVLKRLKEGEQSDWLTNWTAQWRDLSASERLRWEEVAQGKAEREPPDSGRGSPPARRPLQRGARNR